MILTCTTIVIGAIFAIVAALNKLAESDLTLDMAVDIAILFELWKRSTGFQPVN
jgi:hypothetical protein